MTKIPIQEACCFQKTVYPDKETEYFYRHQNKTQEAAHTVHELPAAYDHMFHTVPSASPALRPTHAFRHHQELFFGAAALSAAVSCFHKYQRFHPHDAALCLLIRRQICQ